ncbi:MAG: 3-dehydroquinate synthase [bacterium]|nr:3-dehydroquinate synthase [bacterium]
MPVVKVKLGARSYPITIGTGATDKLPQLLSKVRADGRLFVIYDSRFYALHGHGLSRRLKSSVSDYTELTIPVSERLKSQRTLNQLTDFLLSEKISRSDFVLACGGGILSDLVGFAAASVLRGVRWGIVSTTLLGMVDAAIGGKTGINHRQGKNLVGAFWQPSFVTCDLNHLATLPERELMAGMGEIVKYAGLIGSRMLEDCRKFTDCDARTADGLLTRLIAQSVAYKADIVSKDETEGKLRMVLNLGHTFGHAIEKCQNYGGLRHGEAVLVGLVGAIELSRMVRKPNLAKLAEYEQIVLRHVKALPKKNLSKKELINAMATDKKRSGRSNRFILLDRPGKPVIMENISSRLVGQAVDKTLKKYLQHGG